MATISWLAGIAGNWSDAADWSSDTVPGSGDDVTINNPGTYIVTVSTTDAANSLTLDAAGATLAITGVLSDSEALAVTKGSFLLENSGTATIGGAVTNSGTFGLEAHSTATITGGFTNSTNLSLDSNNEDGGGALTIDGTLSNTGTVQFGNTNLGAITGTGMTVTLGGLTTPVGSVFDVYGNQQKATLIFLNGGTGFASNSGSVELSNIAPLTLNNTFTNNGTQFKLDGYSALTFTGGFINSTNLSLDSNNEDGGGALTIDGTLSNTGTVQFGNTNLGAITGTGMTVTLGGLTTPVGSVFDVYGNQQKATLIFLNGGTGFASNSGSVELSNIAPLTLNNTFTNNGTQFKLDGYSALTFTGGFINSTNLSLDSNNEDGGGALTIDGTLSNTGTVQFGNTNLGAITGTGMTVTLGGLSNSATAVFDVYGNQQKATLIFLNGGTGFASNSGSVELSNIAPLTLNNTFTNNGTQFKLDGYSALTFTGGFINSTNLSLDSNNEDGGGALTIDGTLSNTGTVQFGNTNLGAITGTGMTVTLGGLTTPVGSVFDVYGNQQKATLIFLNGGTGFASNSGSVELSNIAPLTLNNTFTNNGTQFKLDGYSALTFTGGFINSTNLSLDSNNEDGGGALTIDGTLSNTGTVQFGNTNLGAITGTGMTVTLGGLTTPVGSVFDVYGNQQKATLIFLNGGTGFASNSGSVELSNIAPLTLNNTFTNNGTQFKLDGYSALTFTGGFINSTNLSLDSNNEDGGGALTIDGTLSNTGTVQFGNTNLGAITGTGMTVTLGGLTTPVGSVFDVYGNQQKATLIFLNGGTGFASNSGSVELSNIAPLTLNNTFTNNGTQFKLDGYSALTFTGGFINSTNLSLDSNNEDGGGALTIDGTLSNTGTVQFGNTNLGAITGTGMTVTLGGLSNSATAVFDVYGNQQKASVTVTGQGSNSGKISIGSSSSLAISSAFTQIAGTTTVQGAFSAASIDIFGGLLAIDTTNFTNNTTLWASAGGVIDFTSGGLTNLSSGTLTGGVYEVDANSTMKFASAATLTTDNADIILTGTSSVIESGTTLLNAELTSIGTTGALHLLSDASFNSVTSFVDNGLIDLNTGTFTAGSLAIASTGTIHGSGTVTAIVTNNGIIDAANGSDLDVTTAIGGTGQLQIETGSELELGGATAEAVSYEATTGKLRIDNTAAASYTGSINGFAGGDILELANTNAASVTAGTFNGTATTLTVNLSGGGTLTYKLAGNYSTDNFRVTHVNGNADSDINISPKITAPGTATVGVKQTNPVTGTGISISETPMPTGETFTVTLTDTNGLLSVNGTVGVSGNETNSLSITGSLSLVNGDLATLKDNDGITGSDTIFLNATDSFGNTATQQGIAVTVNGLPVIALPGPKTVGVSKAAAIAGVSLSETGNTTTSDETFTATLTDTNGLLSATGPGVSGSGTNTLIIAGSLSQVNTDLTTLKDTDGTTGSDTIFLNANDSFGNAATQQAIAATVNGLPVIAVPGAQVPGFSETTAIAGVSLSETGNTATSGETFTATLTDTNGLLSATEPGVSGNGTNTLSINGSLSQVNADLATLTDTDRTSGSDTITLNATDSFGNAATQQTIAVTVTPVHDDFTGDGTSDVLWYANTTGDIGYWLMPPPLSGGQPPWFDLGDASTSYSIVGAGEFSGDGTTDILWRNGSTGDTGVWLLPPGGGHPTWDDLGTVSTAYSVAGIGDFTGSGTDDILWRDAANGDTGYWTMSGGKETGWTDFGDVSTSYNVVGVGDFTGNGKSDILWQNPTTGDTGIFLLNGGSQPTWLDLGDISFAYPVVGIGDFNGDGIDDILFRNASTGDTGYFQMNSSVHPTWVDLGIVPTSYSVIDVGDYTGNGISDIMWRSSSTGDTGYWAMNKSGQIGGWVDLGTTSSTYQVPPVLKVNL